MATQLTATAIAWDVGIDVTPGWRATIIGARKRAPTSWRWRSRTPWGASIEITTSPVTSAAPPSTFTALPLSYNINILIPLLLLLFSALGFFCGFLGVDLAQG